MSGHYIKRCYRCSVTISQCRCPGEKVERQGVCAACFAMPAPPPLLTPDGMRERLARDKGLAGERYGVERGYILMGAAVSFVRELAAVELTDGAQFCASAIVDAKWAARILVEEMEKP